MPASEDRPVYTTGIRVQLTRNGLWLHVLQPDGHLDLDFIPATELRRRAARRGEEVR
jgi:hypothetical protein